jgi:hypothetical protein
LIFDNTSFVGKDPARLDAMVVGCIPGATKLEMVKPEYGWAPDTSGHLMVHREHGEEGWFDLTDKKRKPEVLASVSALHRYSEQLAARHPRTPQWWYCPRSLRWEWVASKAGDKKATAAIRDWRTSIRDLMKLGAPGPRFAGVCVDCYDYFTHQAVWEERTKAECGVWLEAGRQVMPVVYLGWLWMGGTADKPVQHPGEPWTEEMALRRIHHLMKLCGRVAIHGGYNQTVGADGKTIYQKYDDWPLRRLVEALARGSQ